MEVQDWQTRFDRLEQIIKDRQEFEATNPQIFKDIQAYEALHPKDKFDYKTTVDYRDENNESLLRYAIRIGKLDTVIDLVDKRGAKVDIEVLRGALMLGHLEIAKYLYEKIEDYSALSLDDIHDPACREWFIELIRASLNRSNQATFFSARGKKMYSEWKEANEKNKYDRIAEIGDVKFLENLIKSFEYKLFRDSMLQHAASNNQIEMMKLLIASGALVNPDEKYVKAPILSAIKSKNVEAVGFLIQAGADINYQGEMKKTPLMLAIENADLVMVDFLLKEKADISLKDVLGQTVAHYATQKNNPEIISRLLKEPNFRDLLEITDIYGVKPIQYAIEQKQFETISLLDPKFNRDNLSADDASPPSIDQGTLMKKMRYYLTSHYRNPEFFSTGGHCNGFEFLREMYANVEMEKYYFDTLSLISAWDGSQKALDLPFDKDSDQAKYYNNLGELFEQWINDIIWFQHSKLGSLFKPYPELQQQDNRPFQIKVVRGVSTIEPKMISYVSNGETDIDSFLENIHIFSERMPIGTRLELSGSEHATSAYIDEKHHFIYHDPNFTRRARPFVNEKEFTDVVVDTKIIALGKLKKKSSSAKFDNEMRFFYFDNPILYQKIIENEVFKEDELSTKATVLDFQNKSNNGYTPLHVAVLTGSVDTVKKLLDDKNSFIDINAQNKMGKTALDIAIVANNKIMAQTLLEYYSPQNPVNSTEFVEAYEKGKQDMVEIMLKNHDKINMVPLFFAAIDNNDLGLLNHLLSEKFVDVNASYNNNKALTLAIGKNNIKLVGLLLKHGASLTNTNANDKAGWSSPLKNLVNSSPEMIDLVLTHMNDINQVDDLGNTIIHYIRYAKEETIEYLFQALMKHGIDLNKKSGEGKTAFQSILDNKEFIENTFLFAKLFLPHIDLDLDNDAIKNQIVEFLVESIIKPDMPFFKFLLSKCPPELLNSTTKQAPPLFFAVHFGNQDAVNALLNAGADINASIPATGNTSLHMAVITNKVSFINLLLDHKADITLKNKDGKSIVDFVNESKNDEVKEIFKNRFGNQPMATIKK